MATHLGELLDMLTYMRPVDSDVEVAFTSRYVASLPGATVDRFGNWHVTIGDSPILWSCHTDTVHSHAGRQTVHYDPLSGIVRLSKKSRRYASCLGADDTAGVWLMQQMVKRGVPGHYIFHYGEEVGGRGSNDIADHAPELLDGALFAIALDRKGTGDVITKQFGRCCSEAFAVSLAGELNAMPGFAFTSAPGIYTDTANYVGIVGECTNLSVGYEGAHSKAETLNTRFLSKLLEALCAINPDHLVSERQPDDTRFTCLQGWTLGGHKAVSPLWGSDTSNDVRVSSRFSWEYCEWCGSDYQLDASDATDFCAYCSKECERYDTVFEAEWDDPKPSESVYLDPHYADVIDALGKEIDS